MTHAIPRLTFVSSGGGNAAQSVARDVAEALTRGGLRVAMAVVGADRDVPTPETLRLLGLATGRAVHRLDPRLMPAPILQRTLLRAAESADIAIVIAPSRPPNAQGDVPTVNGKTEALGVRRGPGRLLGREPDRPIGQGLSRSYPEPPVTSLLYDVLEALDSPVVLCTDVARFEEVGASVVRGTLAAAERLGRHGPDVASDPLVLVLEHGDETYGPAIRAAGGFEVVSTSFTSAPAGNDEHRSGFLRRAPIALSSRDLERLLTRARRATPLPPVIRHPKRHVRARVGLVLDECFDLYDEESLVQFEVAGAEITPVSALEDRVPDHWALDTLDGLIIGDGRIERHSSRLSANQPFRRAVREAVEAGVPVLASGGGFAYLTQGIRTLGGSLHPFVGALDGHALAMAQKLPSGHVEVELEDDTIIGPTGTRLRGFVQRAWLLRGLSIPERRTYGTVSGPPDLGCGSHSLFCTHFRPYWPSAPASALAFVDRCVSYAALRESELGASEGHGFEAGGLGEYAE